MAEQYLFKILIAGTILFCIFICFIAGYLYQHFQRMNLHQLEQSRVSQLHGTELMRARLEEQERAMTRISRELHDHVVQKLNLIQMNHKAMLMAGAPDSLLRYLNNNTNLCAMLSSDLRNISYSLDSEYLKRHGLGEAIQKEVDYIDQTRLLACKLAINGPYRTMDGDVELMIYRILQEATTNSIKHAKATRIDVTLEYDHHLFRMEIADNGIGIDPADPCRTSGNGLYNMQQRAMLAGGTLVIGPSPEGGCCIVFTLGSAG